MSQGHSGHCAQRVATACTAAVLQTTLHFKSHLHLIVAMEAR
jgi:hypothetical protein